jgi:hypothetical protein
MLSAIHYMGKFKSTLIIPRRKGKITAKQCKKEVRNKTQQCKIKHSKYSTDQTETFIVSPYIGTLSVRSE